MSLLAGETLSFNGDPNRHPSQSVIPYAINFQCC
jgi:hypothetical protein